MSNEVTFELGGEEVTLKPTFYAASRIPKHFGGYMPAIDAISKLDPNAMQVVIAHGLQLTQIGQKGLDEKIYAAGYPKVAAPCIEFLTILMNGGKRATEEATGTEGEA
jgi:hypothetical protein